jgi:hypothetical protein
VVATRIWVVCAPKALDAADVAVVTTTLLVRPMRALGLFI